MIFAKWFDLWESVRSIRYDKIADVAFAHSFSGLLFPPWIFFGHIRSRIAILRARLVRFIETG